MSAKKYRNQILIIIISIAIILGLLGSSFRFDVIASPDIILRVLPTFLNFTGSIAYIFGLTMICALIGLIFGYIFSPLYLYLHKLILGRNMIYGIQKKPHPEKFTDTGRGFFPALLAISVALFLSIIPEVQDVMFPIEIKNALITHFFSFLALLPLTTGIAIALFAPAWFLQDARIIFSNSKKVEKKMRPVEVRSIGSYYIYLLKGYAGISVIFSFYAFMLRIIQVTKGNPFIAIFVIPLPLIITILTLPSVVILDASQDRIQEFVLNFAKKLEITDYLEVNVENVSN